MERTPVESRSLAEIGYDSNSETLEIMFKHGGIYQYYNVPEVVYERFMDAASRGSFFNHEIKGHFPEAKI